MNVLKEGSKLNITDKVNAAIPLIAGATNYIVYTLPQIFRSFSNAAMNVDILRQNADYGPQYYYYLYDLYQLYNDLSSLHEQVATNLEQLMDFFREELYDSFLRDYDASNNFMGVYNSFRANPEYMTRIQELNEYLQLFVNSYDNYRATIEGIQSDLQEILRINPNFTIPRTPSHRVSVTPTEWFIISSLQPDFFWDPGIFRLIPTSPELMRDLLATAGGTDTQDNLQRFYSTYYHARLPLNSSPSNFFTGPDPVHIFHLERRVVYARARTRAEHRYLPHPHYRDRNGSGDPEPGSLHD
jgi:hypothetical protein